MTATHPYTVQIFDVTTGRDVILAAVDLTDEQRRELVADVVRLTGAPADMGEAYIDEVAATRKR